MSRYHLESGRGQRLGERRVGIWLNLRRVIFAVLWGIQPGHEHHVLRAEPLDLGQKLGRGAFKRLLKTDETQAVEKQRVTLGGRAKEWMGNTDELACLILTQSGAANS